MSAIRIDLLGQGTGMWFRERRAETVASLDRHLPEQRHPSTLDGNLSLDTDDEQTGHLFSD
ncbi:hypothetical protein ACFVTC_20965 [Streptomyces sp. NPDC057950]|uniref:hypothetical protein n=1 Tax=Streptomyces sp. NPDC057950 TaxID=3346288 RepID=UPI0036E18142